MECKETQWKRKSLMEKSENLRIGGNAKVPERNRLSGIVLRKRPEDRILLNSRGIAFKFSEECRLPVAGFLLFWQNKTGAIDDQCRLCKTQIPEWGPLCVLV